MKRALVLLFAMVLVSVVALLIAVPASAASPSIWTDKDNYASGQTVVIRGADFQPQAELTIKVTRPDGSIVTGDGSGTHGSDTVTADSTGAFIYYYKLDGISGNYMVEVLDKNGAVLASTAFDDGSSNNLDTIEVTDLTPDWASPGELKIPILSFTLSTGNENDTYKECQATFLGNTTSDIATVCCSSLDYLTASSPPSLSAWAD